MKKYYFVVLIFFMFLSTPLKLSAVTTEGQIQFYEDLDRPKIPPVQAEEQKDPTSVPPTTEISKNKQNLLQTNDTVNYIASILGVVILIYATYKLRRKTS